MAANSKSAAFELEPRGASDSFALSGVLSFETATAALSRGTALFQGAGSRSVDLSGVTHADSAGLSVLLTWVERARREGWKLRYTALPPQLLKIARLCAVEKLLTAAE